MRSPSILILGGQGYVGSALTVHLRGAGFPVSVVDLGVRGTPLPLGNRRLAYQELTSQDLAAFDTVVLLAGHASVTACDRAPAEAFHNNVSAFTDLVHKLHGQQLIFASSISVYVDTHGFPASEEEPLAAPASYYDWHKQAIERYAQVAYPSAVALRFGTVCGPAPNLRPELLLNSMVLSALRDGRIRVANRHARRPLLGIGDLCRAVSAVVSRPVPPGCYNLASVNATVGEVADHVRDRFGVGCAEAECPNRYDIAVTTRKFQEAAGFTFRDDLRTLAEELSGFYGEQPALVGARHGL